METKTARSPAAGRTLITSLTRTAATLIGGGLALVLLTSIWSGPGQADDSPDKVYDFVYHSEWGATDVGTSQARWRIADEQFFMFGEFAANGLASLIADFSGHVSVRSARQHTGWQGRQLVIASAYGQDTSLAETFWSDDGNTATTTAEPPPDPEEVYPVTEDMLAGVTDPFSAMMTMLEQLDAGGACEGVFQIYDGRRRAELGFVDLGTASLEADRAFAYAGPAQICGMVSTPLGGHRRTSELDDEARTPEDIRAFVAELAPGLRVPVRIDIDLPLGRLITRLDMSRSRF